MKTVQVVKELDGQRWGTFVYQHPYGTIFQTPEIFEVYKNTKNWQPLFFAALDSDKNILGLTLAVIQKESGVLRGRYTARAIVWGGPLIESAEQRAEVMKCILDALAGGLLNQVIFVQFRNLFDLSLDKKEFIEHGYSIQEHLNFVAQVDKEEEVLWDNLASAKRRAVRKAISEKIEIKRATDLSQIKESYAVFKLFYKRIRVPLPDISFFESIFQILHPKNMVTIFLAYDQEKIVGALYLLTYKGRATISYTTSLPEYQHKRPNDLLYWEAMKWSSKNGYRVFDFGGAGNPGKKYGVREFKRQFGGEMVNYGRFTRICQPCLMKIIDLAMRLQKKI